MKMQVCEWFERAIRRSAPGALVASVAIGACGGSGTGAGVGPPNPNLFIRDVRAPPEGIGGPCVYIPDPTLPSLSAGRLDTAFATQYAPTLLVGNTTTADGGVDAARMTITGVDVHVTDLAGSPIADVHNDASGFVDGSSSDLASYASVTVTLLDSAAVAAATRSTTNTRVLTHVTALAKDADGNAVRSLPFDFPVDLCVGCLVTPPLAPVTCTQPLDVGASMFVPCIVGQDQPIDCRTCQANVACHL